MKYDRTVIAYHGCDAETAERLLRGEPFKKSQNDATGSAAPRAALVDAKAIPTLGEQLDLACTRRR